MRELRITQLPMRSQTISFMYRPANQQDKRYFQAITAALMGIPAPKNEYARIQTVFIEQHLLKQLPQTLLIA
ncbi:hypothetical protein FE810_06695 [Thalassotalea litorea]|uniref:Uncharacterized protein n=1 Tax=Thalassotalea litorea TaxID=2020715 RepID=A0A5R9IPG7_9GAMM|nr:hypothetical protein [Thalassotalea litorea]TLU66373.1 hypothetical protein FE810_06695 [Thalassotalea litorea]